MNPRERNNLRWRFKTPSLLEGVIVGTDQTQEWILPWWWHHYSKFNTLPVTFIDFGMTETAKAFCKERGSLVKLPIPDIFVAEKQEIDDASIHLWENTFGKEFWMRRNGWFKKPMACLLSPYQKSIWIDLDCEVRGSLNPLLTYETLALAKDIHDPISERKGYNSGVIVFKHGLPLFEEWADTAFASNHLFAGDQDVLTHLIKTRGFKIDELPLIYNWSRCSGEDPEAVVYHWHGRHGKQVIDAQCALLERVGMISPLSTC